MLRAIAVEPKSVVLIEGLARPERFTERPISDAAGAPTTVFTTIAVANVLSAAVMITLFLRAAPSVPSSASELASSPRCSAQ